MMTKRPMALVCVLVLAAVVLTYGPTLSYGLYWDDFEVLRPWSTADVLSTFTGAYRPWDPSVAFYRPLTAVYYALISTLWGFNAVPMHVIPLAGIATLAARHAMELPALPVLAPLITLTPVSRARTSATAPARSLKDALGFCPSSFRKRLFSPAR